MANFGQSAKGGPFAKIFILVSIDTTITMKQQELAE